MTEMNYEKILASYLTPNLSIIRSLYKNTAFIDNEVESNYLNQRNKTSKTNKFYSDASLIVSYLAIILYTYVHYNEVTLTYIYIGCLVMCLIFIAYSYNKSEINLNFFFHHAIVLLLGLFMNSKITYISSYSISPENTTNNEIIRTIIYNFISVNLLAYVMLGTRISVSISLFLLHLATTIIVTTKSLEKECNYIDSFSSLPVTLLFYMFKKIMEASHRDSYAEKYRLEKFYHYKTEFIKSSNEIHLNLFKDFSFSCDSKMRDLLNDMKIDQNNGNFLNCSDTFEIKDSKGKVQSLDINSLMRINRSPHEESCGNLSAHVIDLFTIYNGEYQTGQNSCNENLGNKLKGLMREAPTTDFTVVGKFKLESLVRTKYFDVHFRKFCINNDNYVYDIIMNDVTELIKSHQEIFEQSKIKEKFLIKRVQEFKNQLDHIIGVIDNIEESFSSKMGQDKTTIKQLDLIKNLSNYMIFSVNDIIHFTNLINMNIPEFIPQKINLRHIANFSFDILKSLLRCNKSSQGAVQPMLDFEDDIDWLIIKTDELKLKQMVLNLISNAVKFTESGWIKIKYSIFENKYVKLDILDTGIGVPEGEHNRLFNDCLMIKNTSLDNLMGNGLGLFICKSLASSLNIMISTTSIYGKGSEFSLAIPVEQDALLERSSRNIIVEEKSSRTDQVNSLVIEFKELNDEIYPCEPSFSVDLNLPNEGDFQDSIKSDISISKIQSSLNTSRTINMYPLGNRQNINLGRTVQLGIDDYIFPKIKYQGLNMSIEPYTQALHRISNDSSSNSNNSVVISSQIRQVEISKKEKILIVDDNKYITEATKNILEKVLTEAGRDMEIIIGSDGVDILHHIFQDQSRGNLIKCILTDENMEYINGSEAIRIIRSLEKRNRIKFVNIISVTGNEQPHYVDEIKNAGAQIVMNKPLLKSMIAKALKDLDII